MSCSGTLLLTPVGQTCVGAELGQWLSGEVGPGPVDTMGISNLIINNCCDDLVQLPWWSLDQELMMGKHLSLKVT